ncbi:MAG: thioesterase family protein [Paludibacterium sp.]|uniref:acyl-CoA thioesterase n=1 Tax=Paludibacterium sp. TaxID=1917523 RepID=UPI0025EE8CA9|nr:thioesterase family protein [Paludibacterium sp.]MBV8048285.1 thioesterase family protein [Paludibacterium sp.]MBV8646468.1 thioesterase family protein [Paludibacterium sp.]
MARIPLSLPDPVLFETLLDVRIGDINYGNHMANDAILRYAHEARLRFLQQYGYSELDIEGYGIIMADAAINYKAEVFHGMTLRVKLGIRDISRHGFDLVYQAVDDKSGQEVARLKTGIVFFDYANRKIALIPPAFLARFQDKAGGAKP